MIDYGDWCIATPPGTGGDWLMRAAAIAGFVPWYDGGVLMPPPSDYKGLIVSMVRHPATWLASLPAPPGFPAIRCSAETRYANGGPQFLWRLLSQYNASTVLRWEDMPFAAQELFASLGKPPGSYSLLMPPKHPNPPSSEERSYVAWAAAQEPELCEHFDYF